MVFHVTSSHSRDLRFSDDENRDSIVSERSPLLRALRDDSCSFEGTYMSIPPSSNGGLLAEPQFRPILYAEKALASLLNGVLLYVLGCMIGLFLVSLNFERILGNTPINWWLIFFPFWLANIILLGAHITSIRHANQLRQWAEVETMSNEPLLPLLRRIVLIYAISFPLMVLLLWSEVAFCAKLANVQTNLYICFAPLMVIQVAFCIRYFLCRSNSTLPGICWMLIFVFTLLVAYQFNNQHVIRVDEKRKTVFTLSWWTVATPVFVLEFLMACALGVVLYHEFAGVYRLTRWQLSASALYFLAVIASVTSQFMLLEHLNYHWGTCTFPIALLFFGFVCTSIAMYIVGRHHVEEFMATKGGAVPVPLTRTSQGWVTNHAVTDHWIMFGDIYLTADGLNIRNQRSHGRRNSIIEMEQISLWKRVSRFIRRVFGQGTIPTEIDERESYQKSILRRTSGSYSDIKIDCHVDTPK